jgi:dCMP deaminase
LKIAKEISQLSRAHRSKVGSVIVRNNNILAYGFNGTPSGMDNCCEDLIGGKLISKKEVLHSESNAIAKIAKSSYSSENAIMYITLGTCIECAKLIIQSGIKEVYYIEDYRDDSGIKLLKKAKIKVRKIKI